MKANGGKKWMEQGSVPSRYAGAMRFLLFKIASFEYCGDFDWEVLSSRYPPGEELIETYKDGFWRQYVYMCNVRAQAVKELNEGKRNVVRSPTLDTWLLRQWMDAATPTAWSKIPLAKFQELGDPLLLGNYLNV